MMSSFLEPAIQVIRSGGVVAVATDTLIGLLALATDAEAAQRVAQIKGPGRSAPLPVLVPGLPWARRLAASFPSSAERLAERHWPGAVTLIVPARAGALPEVVTGGLGTVGLRHPGPSTALSLLEALDHPLTGTSANLSGEPAVETTASLSAAITSQVDLVLEGRAALGVASAIVDLTGKQPRLLRGTLLLEGL